MNKFTGIQSLKDAFRTLSTEVLVNGEPQQAVITQAHLGMQSKRHIHSLEPFSQGDYVKFDENTYLVIEDVISTRGAKYKATIQYCNYTITTPETTEKIMTGEKDKFGKPIYTYITTPGLDIQVIVDEERITLNGGAFRVNTTNLAMLLPDTDINREEVKVNAELVMFDRKHRVTNINRFRKGLLEVTLEKLAVSPT